MASNVITLFGLKVSVTRPAATLFFFVAVPLLFLFSLYCWYLQVSALGTATGMGFFLAMVLCLVLTFEVKTSMGSVEKVYAVLGSSAARNAFCGLLLAHGLYFYETTGDMTALWALGLRAAIMALTFFGTRLQRARDTRKADLLDPKVVSDTKFRLGRR